MADSIVEIFNGEITPADLEGGHDVVTTDSSTSYVIKETRSLGGYYTSLPATINQFPVADLINDLSGSEVLPTSSALNITAPSLTYTNYAMHTYDSTPDNFIIEERGTINSIPAATYPTDSTSAALASYTTNWTSGSDFRPVYKVGDSYYQIVEDNNSQKYIYYWATGSSARTTLKTTNYNPSVVSVEDGYAYYFSGDVLFKHSPSTGSSSVANASVGFSTYPRMAYSKGYVFYIPSTSYGSLIYAINVSNGRRFTFQNYAPANAGANWDLAVSYDEQSDKFYIYRRDTNIATNNYIYQQILSQTKTELDAATSDLVINLDSALRSSISTSVMSSTLTNYSNGFGSGKFYGSPVEGKKLYYQTPSTSSSVPYKTYEWDFDANQVQLVASFDTGYAQTGNIFMSPLVYIPDAAKIAATTYSPSQNVKLRITGVKTTTA